jgi:3'-5' exoribonuclease-like protein
MREVYISVDVETDGPIPGPHSMLSLGTAAFTEDGAIISTFNRNLYELEGASANPDTAAWWEKNPDAYSATRTNMVPPEQAMREFVAWVDSIEAGYKLKPVFVAYPAGFDFTFVYWYMMRFVGRSPFSFSALDMKSYAMAKLGTSYCNSTKRNMPKEWFSADKHLAHRRRGCHRAGQALYRDEELGGQWLTLQSWMRLAPPNQLSRSLSQQPLDLNVKPWKYFSDAEGVAAKCNWESPGPLAASALAG